MQGYLFAKPILRDELEETVAKPDALWRLPMTCPESWCPPPTDAPPAIASKVTAYDDDRDLQAVGDMQERSPDREDPGSEKS